MDPITSLIDAFKKFPGVGSKSARRMVFYLLKRDPSELKALGERIVSLKNDLHTCRECGNISSSDPCPICRDNMRDHSTICVVEEVEDLVSFEQAGIYNGLYHVLGSRTGGSFPPEQNHYYQDRDRDLDLDNEGLSAASIDFLLRHIRAVDAREIIIATNPRMEGDLMYYAILDVLKAAKAQEQTQGSGAGTGIAGMTDVTGVRAIRRDLKISRLAFGLPVGGSIEFADRMTLHAALESRSFA